MIAPTTDIILYKSDLELDNTNQLKFNTWNDQWAYFSNLPHIYLDNATYQRKEGVIRFPTGDVSFDELIRYNYVSYKNEAYANKTFFAYVKNMRYVNDGMTEIEIETDPFQTWQFDLIYRKCFVEREHVRDDSVGKHTVPEGLETGEYIDQNVSLDEQHSFNFFQDTHTAPLVVVSVTQTGISSIDTGTGREYNGIYSGLINITFPSPSNAEIFMLYLDSKFSESPVVSVFYAPSELAYPDMPSTNIWDTYTDPDNPMFSFLYKVVPETYEVGYLKTATLNKTNYLDSNYVPRNKKLLTYPYKYFLVDNNAGQCYEYKYEYFSDNNCRFQINGSLSVGCSIKIYPVNYNRKSGLNLLYGVDSSKLPTCAWVNDAYTNYLTANAVNIGVSLAAEVGTTALGAYSGNPVATGGGIIGIANTIGSLYEKSKMPLQAHNGVNQGDIAFSSRLSFTVYRKSIKEEMAKICDGYFDMFGYKVNELKVPEIHSRRNWNYIKTIDCNFSGDIPGNDLVKLREMFNNGLTLWHDPKTFLDYSQSNNII